MKRGAVACLVALAMLGAACSGGGGSAEPVATTSCSSLLYEGEGDPDVLVVSDFPRRGIGAPTTKLMVDAIEHVLRERDFRAGDFRVGFQSCNDTVGEEPYDPALCRQNARAYVDTEAVVGVIGPYNSGCAIEQIPIVSREAAGPLAMISPANTFVSLTRTPPGGEPLTPPLYPDGVRSYLRVVTYDEAQGAAAAHLAKKLGARRVAIVQQSLADDYVRGLALPFVAAARGLGLEVVRFDWPLRRSYEELAASVAAARPDLVYLAGITQENANRLVEDLRAALPRTPLVGPDSFAATDIARGLGAAGEGFYATVPGIPPEMLPPTGKQFVESLGAAAVESGAFGTPEAAQAAIVLLDAIARSDGSRKSVVDELFATRVTDGILGSFSFDRNGDIVPAPVGIYRFQRGKIVPVDVIRAPLDSVRG